MIITAGFLTGNLLWQVDDEVDEIETAEAYASACREEILKIFPDATVEIDYQLNTSGVLPAHLETYIYDDDGNSPEDEDNYRMMVENAMGQAFTRYDWIRVEAPAIYELGRDLFAVKNDRVFLINPENESDFEEIDAMPEGAELVPVGTGYDIEIPDLP